MSDYLFFSTRTGNTSPFSENDVTRLERAKVFIQKSMEMGSNAFKTVEEPAPKPVDVDSNLVNEGNYDDNIE